MKKLHILLTLTSLNVLLVTIERFSFTGRIVLEPYNFLRLHEVVQMLVIILITVLLPFYILKEVSNNFDYLKTKRGFYLALMFIIGIYFYATGNGVHELGSYIFNSFCPTVNFTQEFCKSSFYNDYYFGNGLYFVGAFLFSIALLLIEQANPQKRGLSKKDITYFCINAVVYALAIFAYSAFDRVYVGLIYTVITTAVVDYLFLRKRKNFKQYPLTFYSALTYTMGGVASLIYVLLAR
jgi:4-amino-4-deoxy-L-arabinose transferase-like glycosyltransferase